MAYMEQLQSGLKYLTAAGETGVVASTACSGR